MENKENKRKKDKRDDNDEYRKEKRSRRARSRSRSPSKVQQNRKDSERDSRRKRKHSKSRSPDVGVKQENRKNDENKRQIPEKKSKETDMLNTRTGGAYIPPARLRLMQAQITDKSSVPYQRLAWEALKKSIHGHINKINVGNIGIIIKELLKENIVRGRGLLCRSVIQAQAASPTFTNVYAALVAAVNSRFPNIGELLLKRLVIQFKRGFKRNDKAICISSASFIAHLVNQRVAHEILALELLTLLVETPTDDSVEVAIAFLKECGQKLTEVSSKGVNAIFEMLRNILHEGQLDKRVQYMIEVMFQIWKDGFKDHPALIEELELVPEEEQFTHLLMLDDATDPQDILNVFKFDDKYEENEQKYKTLSKEILGSDAESGEEDGSGESGSDESEEDEEEEEKKEMTIIDNTETNLVALRRTIYLTINSSLDFEECAHKLMKMQLKPGQEIELCNMFLDCCAEQRTYEKFYGLLAQRFCNINRIYIGPFEEIFKDSYSTAHRLDTNRLRNVSKFFAHLLFTDSISWEVMECVRLNEEDTTSSSRIYIKILFQELAEYMGLKKLNERLKDPTLQEAFSGLFPRDNPKNTRFSINFFTSIGLGGLTDELREHLKQMPKNVPAPLTEIKLNSSSDSSSSSSSSSDDSSSSDSSSSESSSEEESTSKKVSKSKKSKEKEKKKSSKIQDEDNNDKNKETEPERWGHDGFYETYGQGARRTNSKPERSDREDFVRPRADSRRDSNRQEYRNSDDQNIRDRRRDYRREEGGKDDHRNSRDARRKDREEIRSEEDHSNHERRRDNRRDANGEHENINYRDARRRYSDELKNDNDPKSRERNRDNRREGNGKDDTRSSLDGRRGDREEHRRQVNDFASRNGDRDSRNDRRRHDKTDYSRNNRDERSSRRRNSDDDRRPRDEDKDRRRQKDEEQSHKKDESKSYQRNEKLNSHDNDYRNKGGDNKSRKRDDNETSDKLQKDKANRNDKHVSKGDFYNDAKSNQNSDTKRQSSKQQNGAESVASKNIKEEGMKEKSKQSKNKKKKKHVSSDSSSTSSSSSSSSNSSSSDSSESEEELTKPNKSKKRIKPTKEKREEAISEKKDKRRESNDSDANEVNGTTDDKKLGGRYWDVFDIASQIDSKESAKTSKKGKR